MYKECGQLPKEVYDPAIWNLETGEGKPFCTTLEKFLNAKQNYLKPRHFTKETMEWIYFDDLSNFPGFPIDISTLKNPKKDASPVGGA